MIRSSCLLLYGLNFICVLWICIFILKKRKLACSVKDLFEGNMISKLVNTLSFRYLLATLLKMLFDFNRFNVTTIATMFENTGSNPRKWCSSEEATGQLARKEFPGSCAELTSCCSYQDFLQFIPLLIHHLGCLPAVGFLKCLEFNCHVVLWFKGKRSTFYQLQVLIGSSTAVCFIFSLVMRNRASRRSILT